MLPGCSKFFSVSHDRSCNDVFFVYHLGKVSGKSGWKVNGTRLFGSFQRKNSGSNGTSEKVSWPPEYYKRKFVFHYFKAIFDSSFKPSRSFLGKWNWFVQMVSAMSGRNLPGLDFVYHLPNPWTHRFALVNGKQPLSCDCWSHAIL